MKLKRVLSTVLLTFCIANTNVSYADDIHVLLNGEDMSYSVAPIIVNDRTMVPADELLKCYDIPYEWNDKDFIIKVSDSENIVLTVDEDVIEHNKNGEANKITLDSNMIIKNDVAYLPLRAVSEALGYTVDWNDDFDCVSVKTKAISEGEYNLDNYTKFLNKSKQEIEADMAELEVDMTPSSPYKVHIGTDSEGQSYAFGFMDGIDKCCSVETKAENILGGLKEMYEPYERIDKTNIERYIGTETTLKVDKAYGYYLEFDYNGFTARIMCNSDGSTGFSAGLYVTQNEPSFLEYLENLLQ